MSTQESKISEGDAKPEQAEQQVTESTVSTSLDGHANDNATSGTVDHGKDLKEDHSAAKSKGEHVEAVVAEKLKTGEHITKEETSQVESHEHRALGYRPPKDSVAAQAKAVVAQEEKAAAAKDDKAVTAKTAEDTQHEKSVEKDKNTHEPTKDAAAKDHDDNKTQSEKQSKEHKEANFEDAVAKIAPKIANDPSHVTAEDAELLHSREQRAYGSTEKGGITAQAQSLASHNQNNTS